MADHLHHGGSVSQSVPLLLPPVTMHKPITEKILAFISVYGECTLLSVFISF